MRLAAATIALLAGLAAAAAPIEGKDYFPIVPAQPTSDSSMIVVTEFFSYQCPHCDRFAHPLAAWSKNQPPDVATERVAVSIGHSTWIPMAQAYYALHEMQAVPALDDALFSAIHGQRAQLVDETAIADWVARHGIDRAEVLKFYRSFSVQLQTRRADDMSRTYRIPSVPALAIDGRFLVPIADDGNFDDQLVIVNALVDRARRERAAASREN